MLLFISCSSHVKNQSHSSGIAHFTLANSAYARGKPFLKPIRNKNVRFWINYFARKDKDRFQRFVSNGAIYKKHIEKILASYGLPEDLYFVALIESGFYLNARSRASAVGPWQFIRGTGRQYGLQINHRIDDRKNIIKATHAAARYLKKLHRQFRSWELALAAYNMGEYGLKRRIRRARTKNYYRLSSRRYLPKETRNYVPKVIAAMHVYKNARRYGINTHKHIENRYADLTKIQVQGGITLRTIAKNADISYKTLKKLNPEYRYGRLPSSRRLYHVLVPKSAKARTIAFANSGTFNTKKKYYRVRPGDNLTKIASRFGLTVKAIKRLNKLSSSKIVINQKIKLAQSAPARHYRVRRGDNLTSIAARFGLSISQIKSLNNLRSNRIFVNQNLLVAAPIQKHHIVKRGDNLTKIASRFGLTVAAIKRLNSLSRSKIYPGQKLVVEL